MPNDPRLDNLRNLIDLSPVPMLVTELVSGCVATMNRPAEQLLLVPLEEAIGKNMVELDFWGSTTNAFVTRLRDDGVDQMETAIDRRDGTTRTCVLSSRICTDGHEPAFVLSTLQDVTDRKKAEDSRKLSEDRLQQILENSLDMITRHDVDGVYLWASPSAKTLFGFEPEEMIGMSSAEMIHPDDRPLVKTALASIIENPVAKKVVYRHKTKSGEWIWVESIGRALYDPGSGKPLEFQISTRDISDRKSAEDRYRSLFENLTSGFALHEVLLDGSGNPLDFRYLEVNPAYEKLTRLSAKQLLGRTATKALPGIGAEKIEVFGKVALTGEPVRYESYVPELDLWFESWAYQAGPMRFAVLITDITVRKKAEESLKASEDRLQQILENSFDGIWDWNISTGKVFFSPRYYHILGYEPGDFPESFENWESMLFPEDLPVVRETLERHFRDSATPYLVELRMHHKDGSWVWIQAQGKVVARDALGNPLRMVGTHTDISNRKKAEDRYRLLFENMVSGFALHDVIQDETGKVVDYRFLEINPAYEKLTGLEASKIVGRTVREVLPNIEEYWIEQFGAVALTGIPRMLENHVESLRKSYEVRTFCPKIGQFAVLFHDVSEQREMERAVRESEARLREVADMSLDLLTRHDLQGVCLWTSPACRQILGAEPEAVVGRSAYDFIMAEDHASVHQAMMELFENGKARRQYRIRKVDRTVHWSESIWNLTRDESGAPREIHCTTRDISEQKRQSDLLESASRLNQSILSTTEALVVLMDLDGRVVRFNEACQRLCGWSESDMLGRSVLENLVPEDERTQLQAIFERLISEQVPIQNESHWTARDGRRIWISWANSVIHDDSRRSLYVLCTGIDMTAHLATRMKLQESQERWRILVENAPEAIAILDVVENRFLQANPAAETLFGLTEAQIVGKGPADLSPPVQPFGIATREAIARNVRRALEGSPLTFEWTHLRSDGREVLCLENLSRLPSEDHPLLRVSLVDISEKRKTESVLEALVRGTSSLFGQAFFDALVRELAHLLEVRCVTIARLDPDGERIRTIAAFGDTMPSMPAEIPFDSHFIDNFRHRDVVVVPSGIRDRYPGHRILDEMGAECYMGVGLFNASHELVGMLNVIHDRPLPHDELTRSILVIFADRARAEIERFEADKALHRMNTDLEKRVQERTAELVGINHELESFSYSVSHDLRGPLRAINGFSQALAEDCEALLDDVGRGYIDRIRRASSRMADLIEDLLTLSHSSRSVLQKTDIDLSSIVGEIIENLRASNPGREIQVEIEPGLRAFADPVLLRAVLENLLDNSWKYTKRQGLPWISFHSDPSREGFAKFSVSDNGAGFDATHAHKLFGTFQRLHTVDEFEGNGIGLATARRIVERHGGTISGSGEVGKGATFSFELPLASPNEASDFT